MELLSVFRRDRRSAEERRFGTGLWRQHRDRFSRAVDRFYETTSTLHRDFGDTASAPQIELLARLTVTLNELDDRVAALSEAAQREIPLSSLVFPAEGRARLGDVPEHLSRASALVAQAAQSAAMLRAGLVTQSGTARAGLVTQPGTAQTGATQTEVTQTGAALPEAPLPRAQQSGAARFAESARIYAEHADRLIAEAEAGLPPDLRPDPTG